MEPKIITRLEADPAGERARLLEGLLATPASIPPRYFYDPLGCALYAAICAVEEYYPTRTERGIFEANRAEIAAAIGSRGQLVDLGAGDCCKAASFMPFVDPLRYVAVDIAEATVAQALERLAPDYPGTEMIGLITDFSRRLDLSGVLGALPTTFFYPGSSIGNFDPQEAQRFLGEIAASGGLHAGLLIGVDTRKDRARLEAAYDDAVGVTAAFNRNVLRHVNRVLEADFDPRAFRHVALYDERAGRIEMHLEALAECRVHIAGRGRTFRRGERIHTENSYKYAPEEFEALLARAGFGRVRRWQDARGDFAVYFAHPHGT